MIDPRNIASVSDWCDLMVQELSPVVLAPRLLDENEWRHWAVSIVSNPGIRQFQPPDPEFFDDWREWAIRFNQAVGL